MKGVTPLWRGGRIHSCPLCEATALLIRVPYPFLPPCLCSVSHIQLPRESQGCLCTQFAHSESCLTTPSAQSLFSGSPTSMISPPQVTYPNHVICTSVVLNTFNVDTSFGIRAGNVTIV